MAKIIVEIDLKHSGEDYSAEALRKEIELRKEAWFPTDDPTMISIDGTYLRIDPTDDSFYIFKLRGIED